MSDIRNSNTLTGNHLGQLANVSEVPRLDPGFADVKLNEVQRSFNYGSKRKNMEEYAVSLLEDGKLAEAWQVLLRLAE